MPDLKVSELTADTSLVDADYVLMNDASGPTTKRSTWTSIKTFLQGLFTSAGDVLTNDTIVRGDGGSRGVQTTGITVADTTNNVSGMGTLGCGAITSTADVKANSNKYLIEGVASRGVLRSVVIQVSPGATPNTNINVTAFESAAYGAFNAPTSTDATNLAKSGTSGSWSLDAAGKSLECAFSETVVGFLGGNSIVQKINSASTVPYYIFPTVDTGKMRLDLYKHGDNISTNTDWTAAIDASDDIFFMISMITST